MTKVMKTLHKKTIKLGGHFISEQVNETMSKKQVFCKLRKEGMRKGFLLFYK